MGWVWGQRLGGAGREVNRAEVPVDFRASPLNSLAPGGTVDPPMTGNCVSLW